MPTALEGVRVVDASRHMAGAITGMMFADNGSDVIKLEAPGGDPTRAHDGFKVWNRGKRSVVLDLADPATADRRDALIATADLLISDWRPGVVERLGLAHDRLAAINPRLISVVITGFGEQGPLAGLVGHEHVLAAKSGRMATVNGFREGPIFTPVPIAAFGAGMLATQGAIAALLDRQRTGVGQRVHTSLLHALASYDMISGHGHRTHQPDRSGRIFGVMPLAFMTAKTKDERFIQMCSRQPHLFRNWLNALGVAELLDEPGLENMPDLLPSAEALERVRAILADKMRERTFEEWMDVFLRDDIGGDPFLSAEEFLQHPQALDTGRVATVDSPTVGRSTQIGPLAELTDTPSVIGRGEPLLGEHTAEVLDGLAPAPAPGTPPAHPGGAPLAGITVLEVGYFYAAPYGMTLLSELGARVVKVEPPAGDPARRNWSTPYDKETVGKESVVADMKTPEGLAIVHALAKQADVFLHNFRPGVPERLGIGYQQLSELNPRLVYVYGGAFGSRGPWARRPGFHSSPNAISGSGIIEAGRGNSPINRTYADPAGALACATATLLGLAARDRTGRGQYVETTMLASMAYTVSRWSVQYAGKADGGPLPDQGQHGFHALHRLYDTGDGWLFVYVPDRDVATFAAAIEQPGLTSDTRFADAAARLDHDPELAELVAGALTGRSADEWERVLTTAGLGCVRADGIAHGRFMLDSEQSRANELSIPCTLPNGEEFFRSAGTVDFSGSTRVLGSPEPLGNSTRRVLTSMGYSEAELDRLEAAGVTRPVGHGLDG
ncbi:MAG TPA: CoA transferase [Ilumatobacter sp.]|nr:CoA transferase [Ilumatobacter sp.]